MHEVLLDCCPCLCFAPPALRSRRLANAFEGISSAATILSTQKYTVRQRIELTNTGERPPGKQNLWVALIRDLPPYQEVLLGNIPGYLHLSSDEYGNQYAEFDLSDHPAGTGGDRDRVRSIGPRNRV
jgi:hypothetical protein